MVSTFEIKKISKDYTDTKSVELEFQDVKGVDQDDDFASYWLPKLRKATI